MTTSPAWQPRAFRLHITRMVAALILFLVGLVTFIMWLRQPLDPLVVIVRIALGTLMSVVIGAMVSRVVARRMQVMLDDAAARSAEIDRQRLALLDINIALNDERRHMLRLERQRESSDLLLAAVVHVLPDALVVVDANRRVQVWSHVAAALFGVADADAVDRDFVSSYLAGRARDDAARSWDHREGVRFESVAIRGDGTEFPAELTLTPVSTPRGRYHAVSVRDLALAKQREAEARQAQKLEAVGRLASGVAHELNTPIQFIGDSVTFARDATADLHRLIERYREVVRDCAPPELRAAIAADEAAADLDYLREELPRAFDRTLDGADRVATIVRSMKEFAHPETVEKSMTDLNRAIATTLVVARNEVKYAAAVETDFGELPAIACHAGELNQVFLNLLVNAAHAIQDSGKHTGGALGTIRVVTRADADQITVSISDDGCGIPDTVRGKIYDPFFTTKAVGRGTGQGLAIARSVVADKHGGTISFESQVGVGTTFHVRLPLA